MKWVFKNRVGSFVIYFAIGSIILTSYSFFENLSYHNKTQEVMGSIASYLSNWPSFLIGLHKWGRSIVFPFAFVTNAIGWGLVGGIFGLIWVGVVRLRKKKLK
jgi:hypothetical protein